MRATPVAMMLPITGAALAGAAAAVAAAGKSGYDKGHNDGKESARKTIGDAKDTEVAHLRDQIVDLASKRTEDGAVAAALRQELRECQKEIKLAAALHAEQLGRVRHQLEASQQKLEATEARRATSEANAVELVAAAREAAVAREAADEAATARITLAQQEHAQALLRNDADHARTLEAAKQQYASKWRRWMAAMVFAGLGVAWWEAHLRREMQRRYVYSDAPPSLSEPSPTTAAVPAEPTTVRDARERATLSRRRRARCHRTDGVQPLFCGLFEA